ncbi:MAG TPA: hypothetical protein VNS58_31335 [Puia sp.]|nr:hypothetical protein [Puia sp.]
MHVKIFCIFTLSHNYIPVTSFEWGFEISQPVRIHRGLNTFLPLVKISKMRRKYDSLWKGMLEEVFDDMLRFFFPDIDRELDLQRGFTFLDKELGEMYPEPEKGTDTRYVDKLVKVYRQDGQEEWVLCHVEVQGETNAADRPFFGERMFRYYYRIFDRYQKPMTAIAIFTAEDGIRMPDRYEYRFLGTSHIYHYNTYCITDARDEELAKSDNPFAVVVLAAKEALLKGKDDEELDNELLEQKLLIVKLLQEKAIFGEEKIEAIMTFLNNYVLFKNPQINLIFMERVDQITGKKNTMGIIEQLAAIKAEEALEQGRLEEKANSVKAFLINTEFSEDKIASFIGVPVSFVEKVKEGLR